MLMGWRRGAAVFLLYDQVDAVAFVEAEAKDDGSGRA